MHDMALLAKFDSYTNVVVDDELERKRGGREAWEQRLRMAPGRAGSWSRRAFNKRYQQQLEQEDPPGKPSTKGWGCGPFLWNASTGTVPVVPEVERVRAARSAARGEARGALARRRNGSAAPG